MRLGDAVVVRILPEPQRAKDGVAAVNQSVAIAAVRWLIKLGERAEAIRSIGGGLRREVAEQLAPVIDYAIAVAIKGEPSVVCARGRPRKVFEVSVGIEVERDAMRCISQGEPVTEHIHQDGRRDDHARTFGAAPTLVPLARLAARLTTIPDASKAAAIRARVVVGAGWT